VETQNVRRGDPVGRPSPNDGENDHDPVGRPSPNDGENDHDPVGRPCMANGDNRGFDKRVNHRLTPTDVFFA